MKSVIHGAKVYLTPERRFAGTDILVEDGKILALGTDHWDADTVIHCENKYILPGLVDVHTHGRAGYDFNTADEVGVRAMLSSYAAAGTTTIMATLASATWDSLESSIRTINTVRGNPDQEAASVAGIHLEGRYLNEKRRGAHATELLSPLSADEIEVLIREMLPLPAHISAAYEKEGGEEFVRRALSLGATCGLAHSDATYDEATEAVSWGVTSFTHTFNAMHPIHHREPGNAIASLMSDSAWTEIICDGEHVHPAMIRLAYRAKPDGKLVLITDSMEATGCPDGKYEIAGLPVYVKNGRAVNTDGALAGSTLNLFTAVKNFMRFCGVTLEEALPLATSNPAAMVGISDVCGEIREGLRADFLVISDPASPALESVCTAGHWLTTLK